MQDKEFPTYPEAFYCTCKKIPGQNAQLFDPAMCDGDHNGVFTWKELQTRVEEIACGLMSLGFDKQERAAIMGNTHPYWTQADMGISNAGGVSITIYPTLSVNEVQYIINDSQSTYLFVGNEEILSKYLAIRSEVPSIKKVIVMSIVYKSNDPQIISLSDLTEMGRKYAKTNFADYEKRWQSVTMEDWYTILYTSGTTGQGKGVILTHGSQATRGRGVDDYFAKISGGMLITEQDTTLVYLPLAHIFERVATQEMAIWKGATMAYASPATLLEDMQKYNPAWISCVPRLYEKIYITMQQQMAYSPLKKFIFNRSLAIGEEAVKYRTDYNGKINMSVEYDLISKLPLLLKLRYKIADKLIFSKVRALFGNKFRYAFSASAAISPDLLKFFFACGLAICEGYGSTETFNACAVNPITAIKTGTVGPVGIGNQGRRAEDGELEVTGAGIMQGYLNKPEETAESFTEDGWLKTGDLVEIDNEGYVRIVDRKKSIICLAIGKNVAPLKVENYFSTSQYIEQIFVIGDERNFITCLFVPNFSNFITLFDKENIPYDKSKIVYSYDTGIPIIVEVGEDFINQPRIKELIDQDVAAANARLENFERVKKYTLMRKRFTEEGGELTPTMKTKKRVILNKYADLIDQMYNSK